MPGRRRKLSDSSVETVDGSKLNWRPEESILKPVPPGGLSDEWPILELKNAVVLNKNGRTLENALEVGTRGPYIIRGELDIDYDEHRDLRRFSTWPWPHVVGRAVLIKCTVIRRVRKPIRIEVQASIKYAIGESGYDPDDVEAAAAHPMIWVSGQCGWYELDPARVYLPMFDKMCQGTTLYYKLMDAYREIPRLKSSKRSKSHWFEELEPLFFYVRTPNSRSNIQILIWRLLVCLACR
jgi:hypothetical protein